MDIRQAADYLGIGEGYAATIAMLRRIHSGVPAEEPVAVQEGAAGCLDGREVRCEAGGEMLL